MRYTGSAPSTSTMGLIGESVVATWAVAMASMLTVDGFLSGVEIRDLANPSTVPGETTTDQPGTRSGNVATVGVSAVIVYGVDRAYRGSRPKAFTPYGVQADITLGNTWSGAFQTALLAAWEAYLAGVEVISIDGTNLGASCGVSYYGPPTIDNPNPRARNRFVSTQRSVPLVEDLTGIRITPRIGSQRRRLRAA